MEPIKCYSCGKIISEVFEEFLAQYKSVESPTVELFNKVCKKLNIKSMCCKIELNTVLTYQDLLKNTENHAKFITDITKPAT